MEVVVSGSRIFMKVVQQALIGCKYGDFESPYDD